MTEAIGWISSVILLLTIGKQVWKQWRDGTSEGVSKWLFIGQVAASTGFTIYSWLLGNTIFIVTNSLLLLSALVGLLLVFAHRRREQQPEHRQNVVRFPAMLRLIGGNGKQSQRK